MSVTSDPGLRDAVLRFGVFSLDHHRGLSRRNASGNWLPVVIGARALDVFRTLVEARGGLVTKQALMEAAWPGMAVEDSNLSVQIAALRKLLDEGRAEGSYIQNVIGRGYRFVEKMTPAETGFDAGMPAEQAVPLPPIIVAAIPKRHIPARLMVALAALALVLAVAGGWMLRDLTLATTLAPTRAAAYSPQDRRRSVIVLPFENSSGDPSQDDIAASLARDVADWIARDDTTPIVPMATAAAYRGRTPDLRAIGREHDVHFAITGNARREGGRLIGTATVYETQDVRQLWSRTFDIADRPDEWKLLIISIAGGSSQVSVDAEAERARREHPNQLDKRDFMLAALATPLTGGSKANTLAQIALIQRALELDPDFVGALRELARKYADLVNSLNSSNPEEDLEKATMAVDRALALRPNDFQALREKANVLRAQGRLDEAAALLRALIARDPTQAMRHRELGLITLWLGHPDEALKMFATARGLAVMGDGVESIEMNIAHGLLASGRFDEAIEQARRTIALFPSDGGDPIWLTLIAAEEASGRDAAARADMRTFLSSPRQLGSMAKIEKLRFFIAYPKLRDSLRRAGLPET